MERLFSGLKVLEDRINDKHYRIDSDEHLRQEVSNHINNILFDAAYKLGIVTLPQLPKGDDPEKLSELDAWFVRHFDVYGETQKNEKGKLVYIWGDQQITKTDLRRIFSHLEKTQRNLYSLLFELIQHAMRDSLPMVVLAERLNYLTIPWDKMPEEEG